MVIIITIGIIGFLIPFIGLVLEDFKDVDYGRDWGLVWAGMFVSFAIGLLGCFLGGLIALSLPADTTVESSYTELVSLQDGQSVSGSFFLGCGSIDGEMKYTYYYEIEEGLFKMGQINYKKASIKYDSIPMLETRELIYTDSWVNWFAIDVDCEGDKYIFHVPEGTIKNNYNLDAR